MLLSTPPGGPFSFYRRQFVSIYLVDALTVSVHRHPPTATGKVFAIARRSSPSRSARFSPYFRRYFSVALHAFALENGTGKARNRKGNREEARKPRVSEENREEKVREEEPRKEENPKVERKEKEDWKGNRGKTMILRKSRRNKNSVFLPPTYYLLSIYLFNRRRFFGIAHTSASK